MVFLGSKTRVNSRLFSIALAFISFVTFKIKSNPSLFKSLFLILGKIANRFLSSIISFISLNLIDHLFLHYLQH